MSQKPDDIEDLRRRKRLNVPQQVAVAKDAMMRAATWYRSNPVPLPVRQLFDQRELDIANGIFIELADREHGLDCTFGTFVTEDGRFIDFDIEVTETNDAIVAINEFRDITDTLDICGRKPGVGATKPFLALEVLRELNCEPPPAGDQTGNHDGHGPNRYLPD